MKNPNTQNPPPLRGMVWAGLVATVILSGIYLKAAGHLRELTSTLARLEAESARSEPQVAALRSEVVGVAENISMITDGSTGSPDVDRRNATLAVIARLKAAHEVHPSVPPPPPFRMPTGISIAGGVVFPELVNDPEYRAAYLTHIRAVLRQNKLPQLRRLGLAEEISEKVIAVLAEHEASGYDYRQLTGNQGSGSVPDALAQSIIEDTNNQLRQIMGAETYKKYEALNARRKIAIISHDGSSSSIRSVPSSQGGLVIQYRDSYLPPLATRLSYSDSPLLPAQTDELAELLAANNSGSREPISKRIYSDSFIKEAAAVLTPTQLEALRQLQAERLAFELRAKLPKSSELPRNTQMVK